MTPPAFSFCFVFFLVNFILYHNPFPKPYFWIWPLFLRSKTVYIILLYSNLCIFMLTENMLCCSVVCNFKRHLNGTGISGSLILTFFYISRCPGSISLSTAALTASGDFRESARGDSPTMIVLVVVGTQYAQKVGHCDECTLAWICTFLLRQIYTHT